MRNIVIFSKAWRLLKMVSAPVTVLVLEGMRTELRTCEWDGEIRTELLFGGVNIDLMHFNVLKY